MNKDVFEAFNIGNLSIPGKIIKFDQIEWSKHPTFEGVELKHIITGKQTEGQFSYHLVRIAPGKAIKNHIHEKISVKSLSNLMGFNEKYFISIFNKHFGITPALYIKHMRLETAKYDLLYTDHSIAFIADTIGFSTIQKLSKDFKEYTGFTPTEFRKTFK